jgi:integrase
MATFEKRRKSDGSVSIRAKVRVKGYPIQSTTHPNLAMAKRWAAQTETEIHEGRYFKKSEAQKRTLGELVDKYIADVLPTKERATAKIQRPQLEWFKAEIGNYSLSDVTPALLGECRDKLLKQQTSKGRIRKPATVVRYIAALSAAYTTAVNEWEWLDSSPVRRVKKPKEPQERVRYLSDDERTRLLTACENSESEWLTTCVIGAISTGMRQAELMWLKWSDVNLDEGYLVLQKTKNRERRLVEVSGNFLYRLRAIHQEHKRDDTPLVFPSPNDPLKPISLRTAFETSLNRAEIKDFRWHDLRHCTGSYLAMNGASLLDIATILGHKDLRTSKRYAHLSRTHVSGIVSSMTDKIFSTEKSVAPDKVYDAVI